MASPLSLPVGDAPRHLSYHALVGTPTLLLLPASSGTTPAVERHQPELLLPMTTTLISSPRPWASQAWISSRAPSTSIATLSRRHTGLPAASSPAPSSGAAAAPPSSPMLLAGAPPATGAPHSGATFDPELPPLQELPQNPAGHHPRRGPQQPQRAVPSAIAGAGAEAGQAAGRVVESGAETRALVPQGADDPPQPVRLYLEARVWRDCPWASLTLAAAGAAASHTPRGDPSQPLLELGGLQCAARLGPVGSLCHPATQGLRITRLWVINNADCRVWGSRVMRAGRTLRSARDGPCWDIGTSVDIVACVKQGDTGECFLLRCADEGVGVEVVFTTWQLLCVLAHLLGALLLASLVLPLVRACARAQIMQLLQRACAQVGACMSQRPWYWSAPERPSIGPSRRSGSNVSSHSSSTRSSEDGSGFY